MRANPAVNIYGTNGGAAGLITSSVDGDISANLINSSETGIVYRNTNALSTASGNIAAHFTADAEL